MTPRSHDLPPTILLGGGANALSVARNLGRPGESHRILRLGELAEADIDMLSLVLVGNSQTRLIPGDPPRLYTPRGYFGHDRQ